MRTAAVILVAPMKHYCCYFSIAPNPTFGCLDHGTVQVTCINGFHTECLIRSLALWTVEVILVALMKHYCLKLSIVFNKEHFVFGLWYCSITIHYNQCLHNSFTDCNIWDSSKEAKKFTSMFANHVRCMDYNRIKVNQQSHRREIVGQGF